MAIGERIHFFRLLRGMTQKYLGMSLGFPEKSADVRLAQYETGSRTPKADLTAALAEVLDVSPHALSVPDIDSYVGLMHTLFTLEDNYGLKVTEQDGELSFGALALGGMLSEEAKAIAAEAGVELVDYFAREELAIRNAIPTAEGCIGVLLAQRKRTLWGSAVLLLGFGPVGQAVGTRLAALGAHVTVAARRPAQRAQAESLGMQGAELARLARLAPAFDTVVNTIPAQVLTAPVLARLRPGSLIVDLASRPGGTDFDAAARCGHKAIHALSLPAACAPETAGEIVARTVREMLREREGAR